MEVLVDGGKRLHLQVDCGESGGSLGREGGSATSLAHSGRQDSAQPVQHHHRHTAQLLQPAQVRSFYLSTIGPKVG